MPIDKGMRHLRSLVQTPGNFVQLFLGKMMDVRDNIVRGKTAHVLLFEFVQDGHGGCDARLHTVGDPANRRIALETVRKIVDQELLKVG